jgi:prephenate dehydratase
MLADRIKQVRQTAGLTQAELADALGVSQPTVNRWETGETEPARTTLEQLAEATGAAPEWLAFGRPAVREAAATDGAQPEIVIPAGVPRAAAFQGIPGAFSHLSCTEVLPDFEHMACESFEDAFAAVKDGAAATAMIPIENSLGGRVADVHHLLPDSGLYIVGEHFQPVHHSLLAVPGTRLDQIKTVISHPQALSQCRRTLRELRLKPVHRADTAGSAKEVAEAGDPSVAAIASSLAGEIYGLEPVRTRIEDRLGNTTRFVMLSRQRQEPDPAAGPAITSILYQVRSVPAALYKSLGGLATNGVNVIRLESYISLAEPEVARFYIEIEGHPSERRIDRALEELQYFSAMVKVLGVFPAHPFRRMG